MVMPFVLGACSALRFTLSAPILKWDEERSYVYWNEVGYAKSYEISFYEVGEDGKKGEKTGESFTQPGTSYAPEESGTYCIGVRAISSKSYFNNSDEAFIVFTKSDTQVDVTVPNDPDDPDDPDDPVDPVDPPVGGGDEDVLPSNAPELNLPAGAVQRYNYMSDTDLNGISVGLTETTGEVKEIYVTGNSLSYGWSYDAENHAVTLERSLFSDVSSGTDTKFTAKDSKGNEFDFYVTLTGTFTMPVNVNLPSYGAYLFCKNSSTASEGIKVEYTASASLQAVSVDGLRITNSTTNYSATSSYIKFKENYLKSLSYGVHRVELFTTRGVVDFYIFVYSTSIMCYDLAYEFDDAYPSLSISWKADYPIERYEVVVDGKSYSSDEFPERFDGNTFDLTGLVGPVCTVYIKSYVSSVSTPASSGTLSYTDNTAAISKYLDYSEGFTCLGQNYNRYIDSIEEFDALAYYMILYNYELDSKAFNTQSGSRTMTYIDIYVDAAKTGATSATAVMNKFADACNNYKEAIKYSYAVVELPDGAYRIGIDMVSENEALYDSTTSYSESLANEFHLRRSSRSLNFDDFAINDREGVPVQTSDQLFFAIEKGYKPLPVAGSVAEKLYNEAKEVCLTYIDDSMTDYEKVHAIYDWLGKNVVYDYNLVNSMEGIEPSDSRYDPFYSYDSFYLEGVLENGVAVCNGIAKTFVLLCSIEGITAVKVNGAVSSGAHAWNKVLINDKWYIVDSTWSNQRSTDNKEVFTHDYLFLTTSQSASDRTEQTQDTLGYYCGDTQINMIW